MAIGGNNTPNGALGGEHDTPSYTSLTLGTDLTGTIPVNYGSSIAAADTLAFPSGGLKTTSTIDDFRRNFNQLAIDFNTELDSLQLQVTRNDTDLATVATKLSEHDTDLGHIARDLDQKAYDRFIITAERGLSIHETGKTSGTDSSANRGNTGNLQADRTLSLNVSDTSEIGGVRASNESIAETTGTAAENAINGHVGVDSSGYMKILDNAIELGVKTRGHYVKDVNASTGITVTGADDETTTKVVSITNTAVSAGAYGGIGSQNQPVITMPTFVVNAQGQLIAASTASGFSANNTTININGVNGLNGTNSFTLNAAASEVSTYEIKHNTIAAGVTDKTFARTITTANSAQHNTVKRITKLGVDAYGHIDELTEANITYGIKATPEGGYNAGQTFDLNVPRESDFNAHASRILSLENDDSITKIDNDAGVAGGARQIGGDFLQVTGELRVQQDLRVRNSSTTNFHVVNDSGNTTIAGDLDVGSSHTLFVDVDTNEVGIGINNPIADLDVANAGITLHDGRIGRRNSSGVLTLQGNTATSGGGGNIEIYGSTNSSHANRIYYDSARHQFRDESASNTILDMNPSDNIFAINGASVSTNHRLSLKDERTTGTNVDTFNISYESGGNFSIGLVDASQANPHHRIRTHASESIRFAQALTDYVIFDGATQRVGIGDMTPSYKLDVDGEVRAQHTLRAAQNLIVGTTIQAASGNFDVNSLGDIADVGSITSGGNISATGNLTIGGDVSLGNEFGDRVEINNDFRFQNGLFKFHDYAGGGDTNDTPAGDRYRMGIRLTMPGNHPNGTRIKIHDMTSKTSGNYGSNDYMVFEKTDGNTSTSVDGGFAFVASSSNIVNGGTYYDTRMLARINPQEFRSFVNLKIGGENTQNDSRTLYVSGSSEFDGKIRIDSTADSSSHTDTSASIHTEGGASIEKSLNVGTSAVINGTIQVDGGATIGNASADSHYITGTTRLQGDVIIGSEADTDSNFLRFDGVAGDSGEDHTVLVERLYDGSDKSELLIYKGNDNSAGNRDRIRYRAPNHVFQYIVGAEDANDHLGGSDSVGATNTALVVDHTGKILIGGHTSSLHSQAGLQLSDPSYARFMLADTGESNQHAFIDKVGEQLGLTSQNGTSHGTIELKTYNGTDTLTRLKVASDGNIGIGYTIPGHKLDVNGTISGKNDFLSNATGTNANPGEGKARFTGFGIMGSRASSPVYLTNASTGGLAFGVGGIHGSANKMFITSGGNVGIGTTTPHSDFKLDVMGRIRMETAAPLIAFIESDQDYSSTGDSGGRFRLVGDGGHFSIRRNTHASSGFGTETYPLNIHENGNMTIGEKCGQRQEDAIYLQTRSIDSSGNDTPRLDHIHFRTPRMLMGPENFVQMFSHNAQGTNTYNNNALTVGITANNNDIDVGSTNENYGTSVSPGDGNTHVGIAFRRINGNDRGGVGYFSRQDGSTLILNTNEDGNVMDFNAAGVQQAAIHTGKDGSIKFGVYARTGDSSNNRLKWYIHEDGRIINNNETVIIDEGNTSAGGRDDNPDAVLHLRSRSSDHLRFEDINANHMATIDVHETNGMVIEVNQSTGKIIDINPSGSTSGIKLTATQTRVHDQLVVDGTANATDTVGNVTTGSAVFKGGISVANMIKTGGRIVAHNNGTHQFGNPTNLSSTNGTVVSIEGAIRAARIPSNASAEAGQYAFNLDNEGNIDDVGSITSDSQIRCASFVQTGSAATNYGVFNGDLFVGDNTTTRQFSVDSATGNTYTVGNVSAASLTSRSGGFTFGDGTTLTTANPAGTIPPFSRYIHSLHVWFRGDDELHFQSGISYAGNADRQGGYIRSNRLTNQGIACLVHSGHTGWDSTNGKPNGFYTATRVANGGSYNVAPKGTVSATYFSKLTNYREGYSKNRGVNVASTHNKPQWGNRENDNGSRVHSLTNSINNGFTDTGANSWFTTTEVATLKGADPYQARFGDSWRTGLSIPYDTGSGFPNAVGTANIKYGSNVWGFVGGNSGGGDFYNYPYCVRCEVRDEINHTIKEVHWWGDTTDGFDIKYANGIDDQTNFGGLSSYQNRYFCKLNEQSLGGGQWIIDVAQRVDNHGGLKINRFDTGLEARNGITRLIDPSYTAKPTDWNTTGHVTT